MVDSETIDIFRQFFICDDKERVLYGCGKNCVVLVKWLEKYLPGIKICNFVDGNRNLQSSLFMDRYSVQDPSILFGNLEKYKVIVTPQYPVAICRILEEHGYQKNVNYITMDVVEAISYEILFSYLQDKHYCFKYILAPNIYDMPRPTKLEQSLMHMDADVIDDKQWLDWLRSIPPYIKEAHKDLDYCSEDYLKNIFLPLEAYERDNGAVSYKDFQSKYVNCIGGMRVTTDQPKNYKHCVHMFGPSFMYGYGVEDKYTIASCLQRMLNANNQHMLVLNYGVKGLLPEQYLSQIQSAQIEKGDICILYVRNRPEIKKYFMLNQIPFIDMNYFFQSEHSIEAFIDRYSHTNYIGNLYISQCLYKFIFAKHMELNEQILIQNNNEIKEQDKNDSEALIDPQFKKALVQLQAKKEKTPPNAVIGGIVMNCNPFTLGHYHLIKLASQMVDFLYIFVVEEDKSEFAFSDRIQLVKDGVQSIKNIKVISSGKYIISSATFPEYFDKEEKKSLTLDLSKDVTIFGKHIAPIFDLSIRFAGEEPTDAVTRQYNETMKRILPKYGVKFIEIPRVKYSEKYISASTVRQLYHEGNFSELRNYVPNTTLEYLKNRF